MFGLLPFQINSFCILFSSLIISAEILVTRERCIILDILKVLKIVIFLSRVKFCVFDNFSTFSIFRTSLIMSSLISSFLLQEICIPKMFGFLVKSVQSIPQSANYTPFRTPVPAIFYFSLLGFKPERSENLIKTIHYLCQRIFATYKKHFIIDPHE